MEVYETGNDSVKLEGPVITQSTTTTTTNNNNNNNNKSDEDIETESISVAAAGKRFQNAFIDASHIDFRMGYASITTTPAVTATRKVPEEQENHLQKLDRLISEAAELQSALLNSTTFTGVDGGEEAKDQVEMEKLLTVLKGLEKSVSDSLRFVSPTQHQNHKLIQSLSQKIKNVSLDIVPHSTTTTTTTTSTDTSTNINKNELVYELYHCPLAIESIYAETFEKLNTRISSLESVLGIPDITSSAIEHNDAIPSDLISNISIIKNQLDLLSAENMDELSKRCNAMILDLDELITRRNELYSHSDDSSLPLTTTDMDSKINELYGMWQTLSKFQGTFPLILDRLTSLKTVHAEAASFGSSLKMLSEDVEQLKETVTNAEEALSRMETSLAKNEALFLQNIEILQKKMDK